MEQLISEIIESVIFPPGIFLLLFTLCIFLINKKPRLAKLLMGTGLVVFYLLSTSLVSGLLIAQLESYPALNPDKLYDPAAQAIVVLASEREQNAEEYGGDTVGARTLVRSRYGAYLQRKTGLPILVSGGLVIDKEGKSLALVMQELLKQDFQSGEVWLEDKSRTTRENAIFSKKLLDKKHIERIFLVTHAWHMPRSVREFENTGLSVIPAPTRFEGGDLFEEPYKYRSLLPAAWALDTSRRALHEMLGIYWYRIRY